MSELHRSRARRLLPMALMIIAMGCSQPPATTAPSSPALAHASTEPIKTPTASTGASSVEGPSPAASPTIEPLPPDLPPDIAYSIEKRREYGLRADVDWVVQTFAEPRADRAFGFPMLPEEEAGLWARQARLDPVAQAVRDYAEPFDDTFAGLYLDPANERVVTLWTADLDRHRVALDAMVRAEGGVAVLPARWSLKALEAVKDAIDWDWFGEVEAAGQGVGASISRNVVEVEISSANPDAPRLIVEHYVRELGIPAEMIDVISDGTGVELMPLDPVEFTVVTAGGDRPGPNDMLVRTTPAAAGRCVPPGTNSGEVPRSGRLTLLCTRGDWTIQLSAPRSTAPHTNIYHLFDDEFVGVGETRFSVRKGRPTEVLVRLDQGADIRH